MEIVSGGYVNKWALQNQRMGVWTGFKTFRTGFSGRDYVNMITNLRAL